MESSLEEIPITPKQSEIDSDSFEELDPYLLKIIEITSLQSSGRVRTMAFKSYIKHSSLKIFTNC